MTSGGRGHKDAASVVFSRSLLVWSSPAILLLFLQQPFGEEEDVVLGFRSGGRGLVARRIAQVVVCLHLGCGVSVTVFVQIDTPPSVPPPLLQHTTVCVFCDESFKDMEISSRYIYR
jgi:hypothetical protein